MNKEELENEDLKYEKCCCDNECDCDINCTCDGDCNCEDCNCDDECNCEDCSCTDECNCDEDCDCDSSCDCGCQDIEEKQSKKEKKKHKKDKNTEKIKELEEKLKEATDNALLSKAELVNYRKRKDEEISKMLQFCNEDLIKEMLPIIDTFERAIDMDDNNLEDEVSKFLSGFKMMYCNLISILEKYGVKAIDGANKPFDPTYHQAVMTDHVDGMEQGMIIEVLQKGYLLKDKIIRPAMVKVSE